MTTAQVLNWSIQKISLPTPTHSLIHKRNSGFSRLWQVRYH